MRISTQRTLEYNEVGCCRNETVGMKKPGQVGILQDFWLWINGIEAVANMIRLFQGVCSTNDNAEHMH